MDKSRVSKDELQRAYERTVLHVAIAKGEAVRAKRAEFPGAWDDGVKVEDLKGGIDPEKAVGLLNMLDKAD